jgi:hypothetical protein
MPAAWANSFGAVHCLNSRRGRLVSWLPVAFGFGIVLYFTAEREPYWWASVTLASAGLAIAIIARRSAFGFPLALALAAVAVAPSVEAFEEDCARAVIVVSLRAAPGDCAALLIDRNVWRANGAIALRRSGARFELSAARPGGDERPWSNMPRPADAEQMSVRPVPRDATPRADDLEIGG